MGQGVESGLMQRPGSGQSGWESGGGTDDLVNTEVQAQRCSLSPDTHAEISGLTAPIPPFPLCDLSAPHPSPTVVFLSHP